MPIYEYLCLICSTRFEFLQMPGKDETPICPGCGSTKLEKLMPLFRRTGSRTKSDPVNDPSSSCCGSTDPCDNPKRCCGT